MNLKLFIRTVTFVVCTCSILVQTVQSQSNSKGKNSRVVVGTLKSVDAMGRTFAVLQNGEHLRQLHVNEKSEIHFVGLPADSDHEPELGMGVKAICEKDNLIKSITFTPSVGEPAMLGEERLNMTEQELFEAVDQDTSQSISYIEFSKSIYHSPKHGPDSFRKVDKNKDGVLDAIEFDRALDHVAWWQLSRKTPERLFLQADQNHDILLDVKEFSQICKSGNHLDNLFSRTDRDASGSLTPSEVAAYIRSVTHGEKIRKEKQKKVGK